jgi:hypothetical protein|tara:strand:+ start:171 stop:467 length:297 start_codon:yes stop_codon:yes gene_type:complete
MSRYEQYMVRRLREEEQERAGKEAYGNLDVVNSPSHYNQAGVECIEAIAAATDNGFEYYLQGNIIKYIWRYRYKNGIEDLKKAQWYLNKLIETKGDKT